MSYSWEKKAEQLLGGGAEMLSHCREEEQVEQTHLWEGS